MEKIGEYKDFKFDLWTNYRRVSVHLSRRNKLYIRLPDVNHWFPFYLNLNNLNCYWRTTNDPAKIITDPAQWVLGKSKPKPIKLS